MRLGADEAVGGGTAAVGGEEEIEEVVFERGLNISAKEERRR